MGEPRAASLSARAQRWAASGLIDVEFYGALRAREFGSVAEAVEDFVEHGMRQRLSPHPLLDVLSLPPDVRRAFRLGKGNAVLQHLTAADGAITPTGPLAALPDTAPVRAHLVAVARKIGDSSPASSVPGRPTESGLTSVVVLSEDSRATLRSAESVLRHSDGARIELVVADRGLSAPVVLGLHAWACGRLAALPRAEPGAWVWDDAAVGRLVVLDRRPGSDQAASVESALGQCAGEVVVLLDASCEARRGWLPPLLAVLADPDVAAVQPLLLQPDDLIACAGMSGSGESLLAGHPPEDALRLEGVPLPAVSEMAVATRAGGGPGESRLAATSWVSTSLPGQGVGFSTGTTVVGVDGGLRWSLNLPSPPGSFGDTWGDTHYAGSLAAALRRQGQDVVTRRRGAHHSGPTHLDDVALALRGLHPIPPTPGRLNVLWVISHPDDVDPRELEDYDLVFAASPVWSEEMSARTGREVVPLLQASDFERPAGSGAASGADATVVFVGTNLGERQRPLVWAAVESGVPLSVYGPGWEELPAGIWQGEYVPNRLLPELYRRHGIVLADHWPDMARHGFIANRVFDAVASGARVISDEVAGLGDVFDERDVVVVRTPDEIWEAVAALREGTAAVTSRDASLSFDDRAAELVARASRLRGGG